MIQYALFVWSWKFIRCVLTHDRLRREDESSYLRLDMTNTEEPHIRDAASAQETVPSLLSNYQITAKASFSKVRSVSDRLLRSLTDRPMISAEETPRLTRELHSLHNLSNTSKGSRVRLKSKISASYRIRGVLGVHDELSLSSGVHLVEAAARLLLRSVSL